MILSDVMDELATQLETIPGLRVSAYPPDFPVPPAAVVSYPDEYEFDGNYGRGSDSMHLPVMVVVARADDRAARDLISPYVDGSGARSIKAVLENHTYTTFEVVRVASVKFNVAEYGGIGYLNAEFTLEITGSGS